MCCLKTQHLLPPSAVSSPHIFFAMAMNRNKTNVSTKIVNEPNVGFDLDTWHFRFLFIFALLFIFVAKLSSYSTTRTCTFFNTHSALKAISTKKSTRTLTFPLNLFKLMSPPPLGPPPPRGEPRPLRAQPPLQDHWGGDVRHLRQVRRPPPDPPRGNAGDQGDSLRSLRGHIRRQERVRPPERVQRLQQVRWFPLKFNFKKRKYFFIHFFKHFGILFLLTLVVLKKHLLWKAQL